MKHLKIAFKILVWIVPVLGGLTGCNGVTNNDYSGDPYLVLQGLITNEQAIESPEKLRVALLWMNLDEPDDGSKIVQETVVNSEFPSYFQLSVNQLPPEETMIELESLLAGEDVSIEPQVPGRRIAMGAIVVYEDGNANNQLDLLAQDATESIDTVYGTPEELFVMYVEGEPVSISEKGISLQIESGFNLIQLTPHRTGWEICDRDCNSEDYEEFAQCKDEEWACEQEFERQNPPRVLPLDSEIVIPLTQDPRLSELLCQTSGGGGGVAVAPQTTLDPLDSSTWPEGTTIECRSEGLSFSLKLCMHSQAICESWRVCYLYTVDQIPDDLPCEAN
jgi:hypothetical protein